MCVDYANLHLAPKIGSLLLKSGRCRRAMSPNCEDKFNSLSPYRRGKSFDRQLFSNIQHDDEADGKLGPSLSQHCHVTELCRHFRFSPDTKDTARIASLFHPKRSKYDQNKQYVCSDFICRQKKQSDWSDCSACEKVFEKYFHFRETKVPYLKSSL